MICIFTEFRPARILEMTGMPTELQQLWRRRGQLPWGEDKPRPITALETAEIFLRYQLALVGVPPSESSDVGRENAPVIFWHALLNGNGACEVRGAPNKVESFLKRFGSSHKIATELAGITAEEAHRYLYRVNGSGEFARSHSYPDLPESNDAVTITSINLNHMGSRLAERAGIPLVYVELPDPKFSRKDWITRQT